MINNKLIPPLNYSGFNATTPHFIPQIQRFSHGTYLGQRAIKACELIDPNLTLFENELKTEKEVTYKTRQVSKTWRVLMAVFLFQEYD